ncbi:MAG: ACP S-malonyltransferase [Clostridiales bacterium]|nr:ACP S-malonyltransferase [Clostridiales bacterium]
MKLGFVYAGQGSQVVGMGQALYQEYPTAKTVFDSVSLDFDVKKLCFEGSQEMLSQTQYTQPCMVATAIAITEVLKEQGITPDYAAGLSLGEYSALYAAGVFDQQTALELVRFRGQAMEEAVQGLESKMVAILGLDRELLQEACAEGSRLGVVEIANYNCPGQLVIGGEAAAVDCAVQAALDRKAKRAVPLNVSGPFHTSLMSPAAEKLAGKLETVSFGEMKIPVIFNATAQPLQEGQTVKTLLTRQIKSSVYFEDSVRYMLGQGVDTMIEIGPGKVLSGFIKKITKEIPVYQVEDVESLKKTLDGLRK